jgi:Trk-type K+ transport system membrane component
MFIGAGPGSTGGGIRVTTFAILIGAIVAMMRGREDVVLVPLSHFQALKFIRLLCSQ